MPLSYLVPVIPELPILRFTSLAEELLFSSCSTDFSLPLVPLNFYLCEREGDIFYHVFWLTPTFTLYMRCVLRNFIGN